MISMKEQYQGWISTAGLVLLFFLVAPTSNAQQWVEFTGKQKLKYLFSDTKMTWDGGQGEYCADGTGVLFSHGTAFLRSWSVTNDRVVCVVTSDQGQACYTIEQNALDLTEFRVFDTITHDITIVRISPGACGGKETEGPLFEEWEPMTDEDEIRSLFNGTVYEWNGGQGEYCSDGTGIVYAYNGEFPRSWEVRDNGFCITINDQQDCFTVEKHNSNPNLYRQRSKLSGEYQIFRKSDRLASICD